MILKLKDLRTDEATPLRATYDARALDLEFEDMHYQKEISISGSAERTQRTLRIHGNLASEIKQICNRCLEPVVASLNVPFDFTYETQDKDTVDTTSDVRDVLILAHPEQFLCTEDCRGICSHCGANLNREPCRCKTKQGKKDTQESWIHLKKWFDKKRKN